MKNFRNFWKLGKEEFNTQSFDMTPKGELMLKEGNYQYNIHELVKKYGAPLEIVFPFIIEARVRKLIDIFNAYIKLNDYKGKFFYHYPMKVNQNREFVLPLISEGANLETSSANELWIVKRLWEQEKFNAKIRVLCNGPKTERYLNLIDELDKRGLIITPIIEEEREMEFFKKYKGEVGIRVNPNVKVPSHWDKRFNHFGFTEDELLHLGKVRNLAVLSYHISSQIEKMDGLTGPLRRIVKLYAKMREKNPQLDTINIGGGGAVPYEKKRMYTGKAAAQWIVKTLKQECQRLEVKEPNLICEWGRYVAAPAQISIFKVINEKPVEEGLRKKWYIIEGSFISDLPDTWAIHQKWHIIPVNNMNQKRMQQVWLSGSSCDSDDRYTAGGGYLLLPKLEEDNGGQYLAVFDTGAYQDSLANHHCMISSPAKIVVQDGEVKLARKRETPEEIGKLFGW